MTKEELIKELEELRDIENYSQSELMNTGYKTGLLDALDLVNKYFDLALVSGRSEQLNCGKERVFGEKRCDKQCDDCLKEYGSNYLSENVDKLAQVLKEKETDLRKNATFCKEHKFEKEYEWLWMKYQIVNEIRFEIELLKSENEFRPRFEF